ncbi:glycosyltransferase family 2 protein [Fibrobacter sp. UWEL]|uniref:glycosyltransferase family 2 protein n=1 Tax=Fibrobacter sp. UWEL TaxID=1896209 RepID=UPI00092290B4|nr:glycosyltransferase family 2 protein [Fibrobacter sp. UWEL]SHL48398.1 Glycosyl transferase family 2 [Fibrobacter sp. UWEL]
MSCSEPLVSVIVPVYNVECFLKECLDSIVMQKYRNLEILLIDDGSCDSSGLICDRYASQDRRIRVIHKDNAGQASARNLGLSISNGEFFCFVDSDDIVSPFFVKVLVETCLLLDCDIACCDVSSFNKEVNFVANKMCPYGVRNAEKQEIFSKYSSLKLTDSIPVVSCWNKMYRFSAFPNFRFEEGMVYEDAASMFRLFDQSMKTVFVDCTLYAYRKNPSSTTVHRFNEKNLDALKAFRLSLEYFLAKNENDIANLFYRPLMMHGLFCWWGEKYISKNILLSSEILDSCRNDCESFFKLSKNRFFTDYILAVFIRFPFLYSAYRRLMPGLIGDR